MTIYRSDADSAPDSDFEPGQLRHLVRGNTGRMLDRRRTPVTIVGIEPGPGFIRFRVDDFEDAGAVWRVPFEDVGHFQFVRGSRTAALTEVEHFEAVVERLAFPLRIRPEPARRAETDTAIVAARLEARSWLDEHSRFLAAGRDLPAVDERRRDERLLWDLDHYMAEQRLGEIEAAFAQAYVSNPYAGEVVKGHAIVLAELGLTCFSGTVVRDPATFEGGWTRERRREHIVRRLGFVRALLPALGLERVTLWRGVASSGALEEDRARTFTSTSFSKAVAQALVDTRDGGDDSRLTHRAVPAERVFMSYLETRAMNAQSLEAEALLLAAPGDGWT